MMRCLCLAMMTWLLWNRTLAAEEGFLLRKALSPNPAAGRLRGPSSCAALTSSRPIEVLPRATSGTSVADQTRDVCTRIDALLKEAGSSLRQAVRIHVYVADDQHAAAVRAVLAASVDPDSPPAVSWVMTSLPQRQAVAMDVIAAAPAKADRVKVATADGVRFSVLPAKATSRSRMSRDRPKALTAAEGARQTMASLLKTLQFLELQAADVVQVKAFVMPMSDAEAVIKEIAAVFSPEACPPVSLVEWESAAYPVEIELVAASTASVPAERPPLEFLTPPGMTTPTVYCRVARVQHPATIYLSGLYGTHEDPNGEAELRELFDKTRSLAEAGGSDLRHLVKATYYVSALAAASSTIGSVPEYYDPARPPAASKAQVKGVGQPGRTITWDMIAIPKTP